LVVTATVSDEKSKPILDERTLGKLLEAAYVLQEANRANHNPAQNLEKKLEPIEAENRKTNSKDVPEKEVSAPAPQKPAAQPDYTATLGKIVETQRDMQVRQLELHGALSLIAERALEISRAGGAAIGFVDGQFMHYRAVAGPKATPVDTTVPADKALSFWCVNSGQVLRCEDTDLEVRMDGEWRDRGIQSLIAAPVFLQGDVAGVLELYYAAPRAFTDQDVHTCQLMAGLITEALVRDEEATWKKSLASERAAMLEALEKLQPNLAALVEKPAVREVGTASIGDPSAISICGKCGHDILPEEQFCGECGSPRNVEPLSVKTAADIPALDVQTPEESAWSTAGQELPLDQVGMPTQAELEFQAKELQGSLGSVGTNDSAVQAPLSEMASPGISAEEELPDFAELLRAVEESSVEGSSIEENSSVEESASPESTAVEEDQALESTAIEKVSRPANWSSAAAAKDFLEKLAPARGSFAQFWNARRGDIYLAISVILVICVIFWGMMSNHSVGASSAQGQAATSTAKPADSNLSTWDRMLIQLGLAEAPAPAEDKGTPGTQVWVDERTGLYYCPGTDLYGKTPKGRFTTQRQAQLDQFEPAYRKPCN